MKPKYLVKYFRSIKVNYWLLQLEQIQDTTLRAVLSTDRILTRKERGHIKHLISKHSGPFYFQFYFKNVKPKGEQVKEFCDACDKHNSECQCEWEFNKICERCECKDSSVKNRIIQIGDDVVDGQLCESCYQEV